MITWRSKAMRSLGAVAIVAATGVAPASAQDTTSAVTCGPQATEITGTATPDRVKTYELHPFEVPKGTKSIEVGYQWAPVDGGVLDIGLWDATGTKGPQAFRSWAGSRQGRLDKGMDPIKVEPNRNERTVVDGAIEPGTWHVELGLAAVDQPLSWKVVLTCPAGTPAKTHVADRVDPTHVARDKAGWYAGDFHLHAYHSSPDGPDPEEMVKKAVAAGLDIIPVTEYVVPAHWDHLGATQRKHPDLLIWPGREVITYFGHMIVLGETPSVVEHRVGYEGITVGDIQRQAEADGALVSIAHPTIFPPETFGSLCRGCYFQKWDEVDFAATNLIEVVTEGAVAELAGQDVPNPFVRTAVEKWESLLREGHRLTAVSGSDDKSGDKYGNTRTMVYADQLSRPAVDEALRRGHAYVQGLGKRSPATMDVSVTDPADGAKRTFGDTIVGSAATMNLMVSKADGKQLAIRRNGTEVERVPIVGDSFEHDIALGRNAADEGPLGTFWGVEVLDTTMFPGAEVPVLISNPVFLADKPAPEPKVPSYAKLSELAAKHVAVNETLAEATNTDGAKGVATNDGASKKNDGGVGSSTWVLLIALGVVVVGGGLLVGRRFGSRRSGETG